MMNQAQRDALRAVESMAHDLLVADFVGKTPGDEAFAIELMSDQLAFVLAEFVREMDR